MMKCASIYKCRSFYVKRSLLSLIVFICAIANASAQYNSNRNKVWAFGKKAGLDFSAGSPMPIGTGLTGLEGTASVCDTDGHLLFYTNGKAVFNRTHNLMPSGASVVPFETNSTTQAALIVPFLGDADKYYLFSLQEASFSDDVPCRLTYSVVDMSLAGGLGDVVASSAGKLLEDSLGEKMMAIAGNNNNVWLITHRRDTSIFLAYEITSLGLDTIPVVSNSGRFSSEYGYALGVLKASPNRRRIVSQSRNLFVGNRFGTEIFDFDPVAGVVSGCIVLDSVTSQYGAAFSADNSKLYTQASIGIDTLKIYQYNVALPTPNDIRGSKTHITSIYSQLGSSDMRLAPDRKIYFLGKDDAATASTGSKYLDCISSPDLTGSACGYVYHAITLPDTTGMLLGLPNAVVTEDTGTIVPSVGMSKAVDDGLVNILPNPATDKVVVSSTMKIWDISVYDVTGRRLYYRKCNGTIVEIDISAIVPGIYFLRINNERVYRVTKN